MFAPAGYGKSSLLAEWRQSILERGEYCLWISLDSGDDPEVVLSHLAYVLFLNDIDCEDSRLLEPGELSSANLTRELRTLLTIIERQEKVFHLIFDDCERCSDDIISEVLAPALRWASENLTIAFSGRNELPLDFSNHLVSGMFAGIGAADLLFHTSEIEAICNNDNQEASAEAIEAVSMGWPALVQLIRAGNLSVNTTGDDLKIETGFDLFSSYLDKALMISLPNKTAEFLLQASLFADIPVGFFSERFSDSVVREFVDGTNDLAQFITPLDNDHQILRMHPLLREYFSSRYLREAPQDAEQLHTDAALWFVGAGEEISAIRHACDAANPELIEEVLFRLGGPTRLLFQGIRHLYRINELVSDCHKLPQSREVDQRFPLIQLTDVLAITKQGETESAQSKLVQIEKDVSISDATDDVRKGIIEYSTAFARVALDYFSHTPIQPKYIETMHAYNETKIASTSYHRGSTLNSEIIQAVEAYDFSRAIQSGQKALAELRAAPSTFGESHVLLLLASLYFMRGEQKKANRFVQIAEHGISDTLKGDPELGLALTTLLGLLQYRSAIFDANRCAEFANNILVSLRVVNTWFDYFAMATRQVVDSYLACDNINAARKFLVEAQSIASLRLQPRLSAYLDLLLGVVLLRADEAIEAISSRPKERTWRDDAILAEVIFLNGKPVWGEGVDFAEHTLQIAEKAGDALTAERLLLCKAQFLYSQSDVKNAATAANAAAELAATTGSLSGVYLFSPLIDKLIKDDEVVGHRANDPVAPFDALFQTHVELSNLSRAIFDDDLLTETEHRVAHELASGVTDKEIARNLSVSHNTIRFHLKNIYKKLGVANRTQAVQKLHSQTQPHSNE